MNSFHFLSVTWLTQPPFVFSLLIANKNSIFLRDSFASSPLSNTLRKSKKKQLQHKGREGGERRWKGDCEREKNQFPIVECVLPFGDRLWRSPSISSSLGNNGKRSNLHLKINQWQTSQVFSHSTHIHRIQITNSPLSNSRKGSILTFFIILKYICVCVIIIKTSKWIFAKDGIWKIFLTAYDINGHFLESVFFPVLSFLLPAFQASARAAFTCCV